MSTIAHIRKSVLGLSQAELAARTGVAQATVSRWEKGELFPNLRELTIIRDAALAKDPDGWRDEWLFEVPQPSSTAPAASEQAA